MVSKDQSIGGIIFLVCAVIAVLYVVTLFYPQWLSVFGSSIDTSWMSQTQFWIIAVPVFIAFVAIMGIGAWIGWTMATTPPPKPIEEITTEIEEKTTVVEEEAKPAEEPKEEKKPEKKKKTEV
ncbi:MAG: transcriptional regulator [Candidatus Bathyarchaeia archaeon]|jgi:predicted DNA-binding transcriptional regulator